MRTPWKKTGAVEEAFVNNTIPRRWCAVNGEKQREPHIQLVHEFILTSEEPDMLLIGFRCHPDGKAEVVTDAFSHAAEAEDDAMELPDSW